MSRKTEITELIEKANAKIDALNEQIDKQNAIIKKQNARISTLGEEKKFLINKAYKDLAKEARGVLTEEYINRNYLAYAYYNMFVEINLSIFKYEGIPDEYIKTFYSKRIERQMLFYPHPILFKKYNDTLKTAQFIILPANGVSGAIDIYNDFIRMKPYRAGGNTLPMTDSGGAAIEFDEYTVNVDCAVFSDYYAPTQTSMNNSYTLDLLLRYYAEQIADCEQGKKFNRRWIKIPFLFSTENTSLAGGEAEQIKMQVRELITAIDNNDPAFVSHIIKKLKVLDTNVAYHGTELEEQKQGYINAALEAMGIPHLEFEKKERMISDEMDMNSSKSNVILNFRLENRMRSVDMAKEIFPELKDFSVKVDYDAINNKMNKGALTDYDGNLETNRRVPLGSGSSTPTPA